MSEQTEHQKLNELAARVENSISTETARERIIRMFDLMLDGIQQAVGQAAREALLMYRGYIAENRDIEWARIMAAIWITDPDTQIPRNPAELQAVILGWQSARERGISADKLKEGYQQGFKDALLKGTAFGWGGANAGKSREDVLKAAENIRP